MKCVMHYNILYQSYLKVWAALNVVNVNIVFIILVVLLLVD